MQTAAFTPHPSPLTLHPSSVVEYEPDADLRDTEQVPLLEDGGIEAFIRIEQASQRAYQAANTELVSLYWQIGQYISRKLEAAEWGEGVVNHLAQHLQRTMPRRRGFSRQNLFRMRQFYETYRGDAMVSPLVRPLSWTHNIIILAQSKRPEEREFYLRMAIQERWGKRELEQQFRRAAFERAVLSPPTLSPPLTQTHPAAGSIFKDAYVVEFLSLPTDYSEADLHRGLVQQLRDFLIELGRDFCFVGSEYPVQVGGRDFALDLLFFHRGLNCLVAIELKVDRFEPEHLGKLSFSLEALDRDQGVGAPVVRASAQTPGSRTKPCALGRGAEAQPF